MSTGKDHGRAILEIEFIEANNAVKRDQRRRFRGNLGFDVHGDFFRMFLLNAIKSISENGLGL